MISLSATNRVWNYLWKLLLLLALFIVAAPFDSRIGLVFGILLTVYAVFMFWLTLRKKKYVGVVVCLVFAVFAIRFTAFPTTHNGFRYGENHQLIYVPHSHYIWELDHVH